MVSVRPVPWFIIFSCSDMYRNELESSIVDPHLFQCGAGSSIVGQYGSGSGSRDLINKILQKNLTKQHYNIFIPRPPVLKREHTAPQNKIFLHIFLHFVGHFLPTWIWIRIQPTKQCGSDRIRIKNTSWSSKSLTIFCASNCKNLWNFFEKVSCPRASVSIIFMQNAWLVTLLQSCEKLVLLYSCSA